MNCLRSIVTHHLRSLRTLVSSQIESVSVEELWRKDVGFLRANDLTAKIRDGCEEWICKGRNVVPVVDGIRRGERVFIATVQIKSYRSLLESSARNG